MTNKTFKLFFLASALMLASCASTPKKKVESPVETVAEKTPETEELPELKFSDGVTIEKVKSEHGTTEYLANNGLRIIHRQIDYNDIVDIQLSIVGGQSNYPTSMAGIEQLAQSVAVSGGTMQTPRDQFNNILEKTGSSIYSSTMRDFSSYSARTLRTSFDQIWDLFAEVVLSPAMPQSQFDQLKAQQLVAIATRFDSADAQASILSRQLLFEDHPYYYETIGYKGSVEPLTRFDVAKFQREELIPSRMVLTVVGNVSENELLDKVKATFGRISHKEEAVPKLPPISSTPDTTVTVERPLPTHYIIGMTPLPSADSPDYTPLRLALSYLNARLFEEIRTKRNLTYAVNAGLMAGRAPVAFLYVTAVKPEETMKAMFEVLDDVKKNGPTQEELVATRNTYLTERFMSLESNSGQAGALLANLVWSGDWANLYTLESDLEKVTIDQIKEVAQKYLKGFRFAVVGPTKSFPGETFVATPSK